LSVKIYFAIDIIYFFGRSAQRLVSRLEKVAMGGKGNFSLGFFTEAAAGAIFKTRAVLALSDFVIPIGSEVRFYFVRHIL